MNLNQRELKKRPDHVVLPKKGRLFSADKTREYADEFMQTKKQHSAEESAIKALQVHGLDKCLDHGLVALERHVALAVLSRNIQIVGRIVREREREK